ncbi:MAG TPA: metalloregulator ArsR/SmtB family transcription factor [Galbitalea sp.]|jgi:DNA-binding transcriptional ArsR family regulator
MSPNHLAAPDIYSVIGDARRRRILELLAIKERSVGALATELGIAQPSVTQHLAALREAGLVTSVKRGTSSIYTLEREPLTEVTTWIKGLKRGGGRKGQIGPEKIRKTQEKPTRLLHAREESASSSVVSDEVGHDAGSESTTKSGKL